MNSRADVNSDNRLIFGNLFDGNAMPIREIKGETDPIIIEGEVFSYEKKDIKNGKAIVLIALTDHTDSIKVKIFADQRDISSLCENARMQSFYRNKCKVNILDLSPYSDSADFIMNEGADALKERIQNSKCIHLLEQIKDPDMQGDPV